MTPLDNLLTQFHLLTPIPLNFHTVEAAYVLGGLTVFVYLNLRTKVLVAWAKLREVRL